MFTSKFLFRIASVVMILILAFNNTQPVYAAPDNDNFAGAAQIGGLPFSISADTREATFEADEPYPDCGYPLRTLWYSYTPSDNTKVTADFFYYYGAVLAVYTGDSLNSLTQIGCSTYAPITFEVQAGITYYFQLSDLGYPGEMNFGLDVTQPPSVWINLDPSYPNVYDNVYFYEYAYDPAGVGGDLYTWTLWDGTTTDQDSFYHQFTADGDYPLSLTFTTYDGRTVTESMTVQVRTRDIAITKFSAPQTARMNQTREITVEVTSKRYPDNVEVHLYKILPGGSEEWVPISTMQVSSRINRPISFRFNYTFTATDAAIGKVTFRAEAVIVDGRDAFPADNIAIRTVLVNSSK
jgi:hypothetical protein